MSDPKHFIGVGDCEAEVAGEGEGAIFPIVQRNSARRHADARRVRVTVDDAGWAAGQPCPWGPCCRYDRQAVVGRAQTAHEIEICGHPICRAPTDVVEPLRTIDHLNVLAVTPGALWVATGDIGLFQRFDVP